MKISPFFNLLLVFWCLVLGGCAVVTIPYKITKGTIKGSIWVVKGTYELTAGTTKLLYKIGEFTFEVVRAPLDWPLLNKDIETIDGLPVKEAIRLGRVKNSPYTVKGKTYYPMSVEEAENYDETGIASWYGYETLQQKGGYMTANGEARAARVVADEIRIGDIVRNRVPVMVAERGRLDRSLLGMNFIGTLSGFDMRGERLILRD